MYYFMMAFILVFLVVILIMVSIAFFTLFERKLMGSFHKRKGPNKVGYMGVLQPFSDALKLLGKEMFYPLNSNLYLYVWSPMFMYMLMMMMWMLYPFFNNFVFFNNSILYFLSIMSVGVYGLFFMGWSSNSSFSLLGGIRSIAQSISYEVIFAISLLILYLMFGTLDLLKVKNYMSIMDFLMYYPVMVILFVGMLAEVNRTPFDLSESESELVSGFNIEYGSSKFVLIFLSEYGSLMFMMMLYSILLVGEMNYFIYMILLFIITWIRMTMPRMRYDNLMYLCWLDFLPFLLVLFMYYLWLKYYIDMIYLGG